MIDSENIHSLGGSGQLGGWEIWPLRGGGGGVSPVPSSLIIALATVSCLRSM